MNTQFDERSEDYANARSGNLAALFASLLGGAMPAAGAPANVPLPPERPMEFGSPRPANVPMPPQRPTMAPTVPGYASFGMGTADRQPITPSPQSTVDLLRSRGGPPSWMTPRG